MTDSYSAITLLLVSKVMVVTGAIIPFSYAV